MSRHLLFIASSFASLALLITPAAYGETYTQAASSFNHTCAIYGSGGLHCWGQNFSGQLGDGTTTNSAIPVVVPGLTGVTSVSAGRVHTCAIAQGVVKCWGDGSDGQLGNGTTNSSPTPVTVIGLSSFSNQPTAVAVGADFSCAQMQTTTGTTSVRCWGGNVAGQVGSGSASAQIFAPVTVPGLANVTHLAAGSYFACVVAAGTVRCWGSNISGQFGNGTQGLGSNVPAAAATGITNATMVTAGGAHVCAVNGSTGDAWCWGARDFGAVGDGVILRSSFIASPYYFGASFRPTRIYAGNASTCAIVSGQAFCWGLNNSGQLGNVGQPIANSGSPLPVTGQSSGVASMAAGLNHSCAINTVGAVSCWGDNTLGQRGSAPFGAGNPLSAPIGVVKCTLDLDGDGQVLATTDAVLMARAALGYSGAALTANALSAAAPRRTSTDLRSYLLASCGLAP